MSTLPAHVACPSCGAPLSTRIRVCPLCKRPVPAGAAVVPAGTVPFPVAGPARPPVSGAAGTPARPPAGARPSVTAAAPATPRVPTPPRVAVVGYTSEEVQRQREANASPTNEWLARIIVVALLIGAGWGYWTVREWWESSRSRLWVVNTSGSTLDVTLDGQPLAIDLPSSIEERSQNRAEVVIQVGRHTLEARDDAGALVASLTFDVKKKAKGFIFSPRHDPAVCFVMVTEGYGTWDGDSTEVLSLTDGLVEVPNLVTNWFQANPESVTVDKGTQGTFERALRQQSCR